MALRAYTVTFAGYFPNRELTILAENEFEARKEFLRQNNFLRQLQCVPTTKAPVVSMHGTAIAKTGAFGGGS